MSATETSEAIEAPAKKKAGRPPKAQSEMAVLKAQIAELKALVSRGGTEGTAGLTRDEFLLALQMQNEIMRTNKEADIEVAATVNARAMKKALRPENEIAPDISAYNPTGGVRVKPTHIFMLGPFPLASPADFNTSTVTEVTLLNRLQPGDYMVTKADGTNVKAAVKTEYESNGTKPYKTVIHLPLMDQEAMQNWVPLTQLLSEIVLNETPEKSFARMQRIIDQQAAEIETLKASTA